MTAQLHTLAQNGNASTTAVVDALEKIAQGGFGLLLLK